jgi:two-component system, NtrC family, response regulator HydG
MSDSAPTADTPRILVIDDEEKLRSFLNRALTRLGYEVRTAASGEAGVKAYLEDPAELVLTDLKMGDLDGIEVVRQIRAEDAGAVIIVMTGYGSVETAVEAIKAGALDYLPKPMDMDHLEIVLRRALEGRRQASELQLLRSQLLAHGSFEGLIGVSPPMQKVYDLIQRVAPSDVNVLVQGETGTGKELVARAIHNLSHRKDTIFLPINCGALPETILESELFGHEKGAFTGAEKQKFGLVEQSDGGTLFLDEIEEMSSALQVKLLRAIQEREVLRVGGDRPIKVDFRLIATANADLKELMEAGSFRQDLYYRINSVVVDLPPLRDRRADVSLLARHFVERFSRRSHVEPKGFEPEVMMVLRAHGWPGNVRELENVIERALLMGQGDTITLEDLPDGLADAPGPGTDTGLHELPFRAAREKFERKYLLAVLERAGGVVTEAARFSGINRQHFYDRMKHHGISRRDTQ